MTQVLLVLAVLVVATALGLWWRARDGRFTPLDPAVRAAAASTAPGAAAPGAAEPDEAAAAGREVLAAAELGTPLGARATFVQLSSEVCTPCRRTHAVLSGLAQEHDDLVHVDLDVATHLDLVRRFHVLRTPTTLLLDAHGTVVGRLSGATDRRQALAALAAVGAGSPESCPGGAASR